MHVTGMRPDAGFYRYNTNRLEELRTQQLAAEQAASEALETEQSAASVAAAETAPEVHNSTQGQDARAAQTDTSYDYARLYRPDAAYELKGAASDLGSLDVARAVSDLGKDQILQQYQYFVGGQPDLGTESVARILTRQQEPEDQVLAASRTMENFTL